MCAPYAVFNQYKFKAKLTPGHSKRGKTAKATISHFMRMPGATARERDLIKFIGDNEVNQTMMSNAKVHLPKVQGQSRRETIRQAKDTGKNLYVSGLP